MATGTRKTKRKQPDGDSKQKQAVEEQPVVRCNDRPIHLATAVLASYQERTGHTVGAAFQGATIAGGSCYQPKATCIKGTEDRSQWRVQCYVEWEDKTTGLHKYSPKPSACVWVDSAGQITEVCSA